mmetsp:Transcript_107315/g.181401  ORF Transcript_107315/g.181401 Transcript_107315/m.181401 type:complete len:205 (-) Transcript_107315:545-1159(-)
MWAACSHDNPGNMPKFKGSTSTAARGMRGGDESGSEGPRILYGTVCCSCSGVALSGGGRALSAIDDIESESMLSLLLLLLLPSKRGLCCIAFLSAELARDRPVLTLTRSREVRNGVLGCLPDAKNPNRKRNTKRDSNFGPLGSWSGGFVLLDFPGCSCKSSIHLLSRSFSAFSIMFSSRSSSHCCCNCWFLSVVCRTCSFKTPH